MNRRWSAACLIAAATSFAFVAHAQSIPFINGITPSAVAPGVTADQTVTIAGSNFTAQSVVTFNGTVLGAPVVSNNGETLQVTVPASNFSNPGTATIKVTNYAAVGAAAVRTILSVVTGPHKTSNPAYLAITNSNPSLSYGLSNIGFISTANVATFVTGDFNNDGVMDVAAGKADGTVQIFLGDGKGGYGATATLGTSGTSSVGALAVGDFNNDGYLDFVVGLVNAASGTSSVQVYLGNGDGTATASAAVPFTTAVAVDPGSGQTLAVAVNGLAVGDVNGDGSLDVYAISASSQTSYIILGDGSGGLTGNQAGGGSDFQVTPGATGLVAADFNNDGLTDFAYVDSTLNELVVLQAAQLTPGFFILNPSIDSGLGSTPTGLVEGDFNGDGITDLVIASHGTGTYTLLLGTGTGGFTNSGSGGGAKKIVAAAKTKTASAASSTTAPFPSTGGTTTSIAAGDFNGDGIVDIALYDGTTLNIYLGDGSGNFNYSAELVTNDTTGNAGLAAGNVNNDGYPGFIVGVSSSLAAITTPAPIPTASAPASANIGSSNVGAAITATVVLSNTGAGPLSVTSVTTAAPFSVTTDGCSNTAVPANGGTCSVTVAFTPAAVGAASGTLTFNDNSSTGPSQVTNLSGTGLGAIATLSTTTLAFGSQTVGSTSAAQTVTVKNTGNANLTFNSVSAAAPFSVSNNGCTSPVASGSSCTISVVFTPTATGAAPPTNLIISDNSIPTATQQVALTGSGVNPTGPKATVTPASLTFGNQLAGTTSAPQSVTLKNTGASALTISSITATAPFQITGKSCGASLAVNASCTVTVVFRPATAGAAAGTVTFTDNSVLASTQTVSLSGTGTTPTASVSPASLTFGTVAVNGTSTSQTVTIANTGSAALSIGGITINGNFAISANTCRTTLAAGANCSVSVIFTPRSTGALTGTLTVTDNSSTGTTQKVSLSGTGANIRVSLTPNSLTFFARANVKSAAQTVTVTNTGTVALSGLSIALAGNGAVDFTIASNTCGATLAVSANCKVGITYVSKTNGQFSAQLNVSSNAPTASVSLVGYTF